jgi:hypothetical protein
MARKRIKSKSNIQLSKQKRLTKSDYRHINKKLGGFFLDTLTIDKRKSDFTATEKRKLRNALKSATKEGTRQILASQTLVKPTKRKGETKGQYVARIRKFKEANQQFDNLAGVAVTKRGDSKQKFRVNKDNTISEFSVNLEGESGAFLHIKPEQQPPSEGSIASELSTAIKEGRKMAKRFDIPERDVLISSTFFGYVIKKFQLALNLVSGKSVAKIVRDLLNAVDPTSPAGENFAEVVGSLSLYLTDKFGDVRPDDPEAELDIHLDAWTGFQVEAFL